MKKLFLLATVFAILSLILTTANVKSNAPLRPGAIVADGSSPPPPWPPSPTLLADGSSPPPPWPKLV